MCSVLVFYRTLILNLIAVTCLLCLILLVSAGFTTETVISSLGIVFSQIYILKAKGSAKLTDDAVHPYFGN